MQPSDSKTVNPQKLTHIPQVTQFFKNCKREKKKKRGKNELGLQTPKNFIKMATN